MRVSNPMPQFDIKTTNAVMKIKSQRLQMKVEKTPAKMTVRRTRPKMRVNWKKVFSESGRRSPDALRRYMQQRYRQMALQGIQETGSEYYQYSELQNHPSGGPNVVATVTLHNVLRSNMPVADVANMPASSPEVEWDMGSMEIEWEPAKLEITWEGEFRPKLEVTPHTVEIRLINGETIRVAENEAESLERQGYGRRLDKRV